MTQNEELVFDLLKMLEQRASPDQFQKFYHADVEQTEFPNAITKHATTRTLNDLKEASERGSKILRKEEYTVKNLLSVSDTVVLECIWRGTLALQPEVFPSVGNK